MNSKIERMEDERKRMEGYREIARKTGVRLAQASFYSGTHCSTQTD